MAYYAALVSLVQLLKDVIHRDRYPNLLLDKQQIAPVCEKFSLLQMLLDDYSPKDRETADSLERRIRDAAYLAQDIIEPHISHQMHQYLLKKNQLQDIIESEIPNQVHRKDKTHGMKRVLGHLTSSLKKAPHQLVQPQRCEELRLDYVSKEYQDLENVKEKVNSIVELEEVKKEVDSIVQELMRIKESHTIEDNLQLDYYSADAGTSNQASGANTVVGFEEHFKAIKDQLCGERSKLQVVSIIGMGGIGKTTLARKIFEDGLIVYKFDCRAWVTVSQDYHQQKVLLGILDSMNVPTDKSSEVGELEEKIYKHLKGRRYFVIMDDMWDTKIWDDVKRFLPDDSNGSRIMITTRISNVASHADKFGFYHQLQLLNEDQSWNLFREKVFCPPELEDIGRLISKNCRGLPLAIVVVAGLLAKANKTQRDWEEIARNVSSVAAENNEHFSKILSLSYSHLPHHLKPCLLHIGGFPEDYKIHVSKLFKLWIAEGFLKPIESKSFEAVAEEYLEDLVNRNLVLITKKGSNGKIKCCGIHDLLRDLCTKIISYENFLHVVHKGFCLSPAAATMPTTIRRLCIHFYLPFGSLLTEEEQLSPRVRSIISHTNGLFMLEFLFREWSPKLLRVLDATREESTEFIAKILELFHLRYLCIRVNEIPASISLLQNLETLIIKSGSQLIRSFPLPSEIREMPNLRHIMSSGKVQFKCQFFEEGIVGEPFILENLQTLSWVKDVRFTNEVIEMIPNLQKLKVFYNQTSEVWREFRLDNLFHLCQLQTLNINFCDTSRCKANPLPENFAFPLTLEKLSLGHCRLPWKDITVLGSLPNLQALKLRDDAFVGEKWELVEMEFPQLKFLLMKNLGLKHWQAENTHFPRLQHLKIIYCTKLREIPPEIGEISSLELVEVNSSELAAKSALKMQQEQQDMGDDFLQVHVYSELGNFSVDFQVADIDVELQDIPEDNSGIDILENNSEIEILEDNSEIDILEDNLFLTEDDVAFVGKSIGLRTYTRVYKRGAVGRSIDITRYSGYDELKQDLARRFGIEGQLEDRQRIGWKLAYVDHEYDVLLFGDEPWEEFVNCVYCIIIISPQEVQQISLDGYFGDEVLPNQDNSEINILEDNLFPAADHVAFVGKSIGMRTYIKVYKSGAVGRLIDITRYSGYDELKQDLARRFGIEGQLEDRQRISWKFVYVDHENDELLVGEGPWVEFVNCVRCIKILSPQEVQRMSLDGDFGDEVLPNQDNSEIDILEDYIFPAADHVAFVGKSIGMRTYIKVYKRGAIGRLIDITRYSGYDELKQDLARRFGIGGQLEDRQRISWKLVYVDHENDVLLVGEDPWEEFMDSVRSIRILSPQEVQRMSWDGNFGDEVLPNQARSSSDNAVN